MIERSNVPCNGCNACCQNDAIVLHPELGDDLSSYEHEPYFHPINRGPCYILKHVDGHCIYLVDGACSIWERSPAICREFDCRKLFLSLDRTTRRRIVKDGLADKAVFEAGRKRLGTLDRRQG
jgi:uncharacterized protein